MTKKGTISSFMLEEHGKILTLLNEFKKNANSKNADDYFKKLKWKQENHVLAEEKAILILTQDGKELKSIILEILKQHNELHDIMKKIQDKLDRSTDHYEENLKALLELMKIHINLENKKFYPLLDRDLDDKTKKLIMSKFREVIMGNISI